MGFGVQLVADQAGNVLELLAVILLRILPRLPEADRQHPVGIVGRDEGELIHKSILVFQDGEGFVPNGIANFPGFAAFGCYLNDSGEHPSAPFVVGG